MRDYMALYRISILADNFVKKPDLKAEHGFSCLIQSDRKNILFDTGTDDLFIKNAATMNIELYGIDNIVLSHGHYDHTGGVDAALTIAPRSILIAHQAARLPKFNYTPGKPVRYIGMPEKTIRALDHAAEEQRLVIVNQTEWQLCNGMKLLSLPEGSNLSPQWPFYRENLNGEKIKDKFEDELSLLLEGENTACLISGCSHCGLHHIIEKATQISSKPIKYVLGGTHLDDANDALLEQTTDILVRLGASCFFGHCTGMNGYARLQTRLGNLLAPLGVGNEIDFDL